MKTLNYLRFDQKNTFDYSRRQIIDNHHELFLPKPLPIRHKMDELRVRNFVANAPLPRQIPTVDLAELERMKLYGKKVDIDPTRLAGQMAKMTMKLPFFDQNARPLKDQTGRVVYRDYSFKQLFEEARRLNLAPALWQFAIVVGARPQRVQRMTDQQLAVMLRARQPNVAGDAQLALLLQQQILGQRYPETAQQFNEEQKRAETAAEERGDVILTQQQTAELAQLNLIRMYDRMTNEERRKLSDEDIAKLMAIGVDVDTRPFEEPLFGLPTTPEPLKRHASSPQQQRNEIMLNLTPDTNIARRMGEDDEYKLQRVQIDLDQRNQVTDALHGWLIQIDGGRDGSRMTMDPAKILQRFVSFYSTDDRWKDEQNINIHNAYADWMRELEMDWNNDAILWKRRAAQLKIADDMIPNDPNNTFDWNLGVPGTPIMIDAEWLRALPEHRRADVVQWLFGEIVTPQNDYYEEWQVLGYDTPQKMMQDLRDGRLSIRFYSPSYIAAIVPDDAPIFDDMKDEKKEEKKEEVKSDDVKAQLRWGDPAISFRNDSALAQQGNWPIPSAFNPWLPGNPAVVDRQYIEQIRPADRRTLMNWLHKVAKKNNNRGKPTFVGIGKKRIQTRLMENVAHIKWEDYDKVVWIGAKYRAEAAPPREEPRRKEEKEDVKAKDEPRVSIWDRPPDVPVAGPMAMPEPHRPAEVGSIWDRPDAPPPPVIAEMPEVIVHTAAIRPGVLPITVDDRKPFVVAPRPRTPEEEKIIYHEEKDITTERETSIPADIEEKEAEKTTAEQLQQMLGIQPITELIREKELDTIRSKIKWFTSKPHQPTTIRDPSTLLDKELSTKPVLNPQRTKAIEWVKKVQPIQLKNNIFSMGTMPLFQQTLLASRFRKIFSNPMHLMRPAFYLIYKGYAPYIIAEMSLSYDTDRISTFFHRPKYVTKFKITNSYRELKKISKTMPPGFADVMSKFIVGTNEKAYLSALKNNQDIMIAAMKNYELQHLGDLYKWPSYPRGSNQLGQIFPSAKGLEVHNPARSKMIREIALYHKKSSQKHQKNKIHMFYQTTLDIMKAVSSEKYKKWWSNTHGTKVSGVIKGVKTEFVDDETVPLMIPGAPLIIDTYYLQIAKESPWDVLNTTVGNPFLWIGRERGFKWRSNRPNMSAIMKNEAHLKFLGTFRDGDTYKFVKRPSPQKQAKAIWVAAKSKPASSSAAQIDRPMTQTTAPMTRAEQANIPKKSASTLAIDEQQARLLTPAKTMQITEHFVQSPEQVTAAISKVNVEQKKQADYEAKLDALAAQTEQKQVGDEQRMQMQKQLDMMDKTLQKYHAKQPKTNMDYIALAQMINLKEKLEVQLGIRSVADLTHETRESLQRLDRVLLEPVEVKTEKKDVSRTSTPVLAKGTVTLKGTMVEFHHQDGSRPQMHPLTDFKPQWQLKLSKKRGEAIPVQNLNEALKRFVSVPLTPISARMRGTIQAVGKEFRWIDVVGTQSMIEESLIDSLHRIKMQKQPDKVFTIQKLERILTPYARAALHL